ncbi:MAG: hypothetical protein EZS28_032798 [Streblomastix strix]|uniref:Uncharacterized protein n=1 Tax=Streblomastix strix TaxID=222440 RepID=A0A5J4UM04_9EUKA|nr:MAG: hypothetical protein EZS28_032798 [Streblomastix strix]
MTIRQLVRDEKDASILMGALDLLDERETQRFAIHSIQMTEAAMADMIMGDIQMRLEVVIASKDTMEVLKTNGSATLLYGSESKKNVKEVFNSSKLIANQESTGITTAGKSEAAQQSQQQVQAIQPTQQKQKFTGFRTNGNGSGWNNKFFQQPATFANWAQTN